VVLLFSSPPEEAQRHQQAPSPNWERQLVFEGEFPGRYLTPSQHGFNLCDRRSHLGIADHLFFLGREKEDKKGQLFPGFFLFSTSRPNVIAERFFKSLSKTRTLSWKK